MLYFSIGISGPVADWCDLALSRLVALNGGLAARLEGAGSVLESAAIALVRSGADSLAFAIRRFDADLLVLLREINAPFLLSLDDPRHMVRDNDVDALRATANLCPLLMQSAVLPNALCITEVITREPVRAFSKIARHFHFKVAPSDIERLASTMPLMQRKKDCPSEAAQGALGPYAEFFEDGPLDHIVWTNILFMRAADPLRPLSEPVRLRDTFNGRYLVYGPYLLLPPGQWQAELLMTISSDGGGQTLTVDVFNGEVLSTVRCISRPGDFKTPVLDFTIDDAPERPLEIRLLIEREGCPGALLFHRATLRRRAGTPGGSQA